MQFSTKIFLVCLAVAFFSSSSSSPVVNALFQDEAGQNDFTIASAGHGQMGITNAQLSTNGQSVLTSSSSPFSIMDEVAEDFVMKKCYLSSRSMRNGSLLWRRNVCSSEISTSATNDTSTNNRRIRYAVHSNPNDAFVYTLDDVGVLRKWNEENGDLIQQLPTESNRAASKKTAMIITAPPKLLPLTNTLLGCLLQDSRDEIIIYDMKEEKIVERISASAVLNKAKVTSMGKKRIGHIITSMDGGNIIAAFVTIQNGEIMTTLEEIGIVDIHTKKGKALHQLPHEQNDANSFISIAPVQVAKSKSTKAPTSIIAIVDDHVAWNSNENTLFAYTLQQQQSEDDHNNHVIAKSLGGVVKNGIGYLNCDGLFATFKKGTVEVSYKKLMTKTHDWNNNDHDDVAFVKMLKCNQNGDMTALLTTVSGSTVVFDINHNDVLFEAKWKAEEGFGSVTSTTFLDWSPKRDDEGTVDEEDALIESLTFSSRLNSQIESLMKFASGGFVEVVSNFFKASGSNQGGSDSSGKEIIFGLKKIAVMLSNPFSKILAIDTANSGTIVWKMSLSQEAKWHKVVHGAASSKSSVFGQGMHHPHSPEILVLSQLTDSIEWRCVDGLNGRVLSESRIPLAKPVVQIMPIHGHHHGSGGCKQNALLLLEDNTSVVVPNTTQSVSEVSKVIKNGLYSHKIEKDTGRLTTLKIQPDSNESIVIGEALFDPSMERIINVAYPQRNEVVQSPSTILGDDALLLKYLNPHICVIVTEATDNLINHLAKEEDGIFHNVLSVAKSGSGNDQNQKKKPVGVTTPGEDSPSTATKTPSPTLFINVVDTVSGQILHRASHAHIAPESKLSGDANVPVVISENWIVYAFPNARSRRTELGVITLHEGMIDKQGISAFSTPEQQETFSSLTSPKPVALTKTYALSLPVSAIGVTNTKNGISSKNILLATGAAGNVVKIDRRLLDPRRPSGEPKDSEKKEGLMQ